MDLVPLVVPLDLTPAEKPWHDVLTAAAVLAVLFLSWMVWGGEPPIDELV